MPGAQKEVGFINPSGQQYVVEITESGKQDPLFTDLSGSLKVFQLHGEVVELAPSMQLLATAPGCLNQVVKIGDKAYGIQSHFELTDEMLKEWAEQDPDLTPVGYEKLKKDFVPFVTNTTISAKHCFIIFCVSQDYCSMRKQQQVWHDEHATAAAIPGIAEADPSGGLVYALEYLQKKGVNLGGKAIDIGCGKGRNSVYLAKVGYEVYALDYIKPALEAGEQLAKTMGVSTRIHFKQTEIDAAWPLEDNFFDFALDSYASIDIETLTGRTTCRDEMLRTLKPGGYALIIVVAADDEMEQHLMATSPGPEPNSTIWPQNGKFQKNYDEAELRAFYKDVEIIELEKIAKTAFKLGKEYQAVNFRLLVRKAIN